MTSSGIFELSALTAGSNRAANVLVLVDTGDTTQAAQGSTKKVLMSDLFLGASVPVTVSSPFPNISQAWNAGGVTFTAVKLNVTDTASASGSLLLDLQVGGTSKAKVSKAGLLTLAGGIACVGPVSGVTTLTATNVEGTIATAAQPNITTVGTLAALSVSGAITLTATASQIVPGATSLALRNNANDANNVLISNAGAMTVRLGITHGSAVLLTTSVALTNGASSLTATMTNSPFTGDPTKWVSIVDNGTTRWVPTWSA